MRYADSEARPKLDRGGVPKAPRKARSRPQLPRLRPGEIPGIRADRRPFVVWTIVLASVLVTVALKAGLLDYADVQLVAGAEDPWRAFTTLFAYVVHRLRSGVRRRDRAVRLAARAPPRLVGAAARVPDLRRGRRVRGGHLGPGDRGGANGAALGMLAGVGDARRARPPAGPRGRQRPARRVAISAVLVLLPLATTDASGIAGSSAAPAGILLGLVLAKLPERSGVRGAPRGTAYVASNSPKHRPLGECDFSALSTVAALARAARRAGSELASAVTASTTGSDQRERERTWDADDVGPLARAHQRGSRLGR